MPITLIKNQMMIKSSLAPVFEPLAYDYATGKRSSSSTAITTVAALITDNSNTGWRVGWAAVTPGKSLRATFFSHGSSSGNWVTFADDTFDMTSDPIGGNIVAFGYSGAGIEALETKTMIVPEAAAYVLVFTYSGDSSMGEYLVIEEGAPTDEYVNVFAAGGEGGGGGDITVDAALSTISENPVQNKVITAALNQKANAADVPTATSDLTNDSGYQTAAQVETAINSHLSAVYKAAGSLASIAALPAPSATYLGYVYDIETAFTTTADFIEGAGIAYPAGTDVVIVAVESGGTTTYKYDALSGFVDLSGYIQANQGTANAGKFMVVGADGIVAPVTVPNASEVAM